MAGQGERELGGPVKRSLGMGWEQPVQSTFLLLFVSFAFLATCTGVSGGGLYELEGKLPHVGNAGCSNTAQTSVSVLRRQEKSGADSSMGQGIGCWLRFRLCRGLGERPLCAGREVRPGVQRWIKFLPPGGPVM